MTELDIALEAERWISSLQRTTDHGIAWGHSREEPDRISHTLYNGSPGIIVFYLELHSATEQTHFLDIACSGADDLASYARTTSPKSCSLSAGWPGFAFALAEVGRCSGEERFTVAAVDCRDRLHDSSQNMGSGIGWIEPMPFSDVHGFTGDREVFDASSGAASAGFALLYAARTRLHSDALEWARQVGDRLLEVAEPTEDGLNWSLMSDMPFPWNPSNFAHGAAGVGSFMALLHEATGDGSYLDAATAAAAHIASIASEVGDGHLVHHNDFYGSGLYYLSACHGPPGTTRLFNVLHRITGDRQYADWTDGALRGLLSTGVPEQRTDGFWDNVSQCCGDAGVGDWAAASWQETQDDRYLDLARREAAVLSERRLQVGDGCCWPQVEHRNRPEFVQAQTGYMQGAAGLGSFLLHLGTALAGDPVRIALPDECIG